MSRKGEIKKDCLPFFHGNLNSHTGSSVYIYQPSEYLGLQFYDAYASIIDTVRIIIFDFICVAEIRRQGESSFLIAKQFFTQTEKRGHVPLRVIFSCNFLYQLPCCFC